jgi:hypothetical protein
MLADEILDLGLRPGIQRVVGGAHVCELGAAAPGRDGPRREQRELRGNLCEGTVGMPQPVAQLEEPLAIVGRDDLAILVEVGEIGDSLTEAGFRRLADCAGPLLDLERTEIPREGDLLLIGDVLVVKNQHTVAIHRILDGDSVLAADRLGEVDARRLSSKDRMELPDGDRHDDLPALTNRYYTAMGLGSKS